MEDSHDGGKQRRLSERLVVLGIIITATENEHDVVCRPSRVAARLQQIQSTVVSFAEQGDSCNNGEICGQRNMLELLACLEGPLEVSGGSST
jgi:hypothetical protein